MEPLGEESGRGGGFVEWICEARRDPALLEGWSGLKCEGGGGRTAAAAPMVFDVADAADIGGLRGEGGTELRSGAMIAQCGFIS